MLVLKIVLIVIWVLAGFVLFSEAIIGQDVIALAQKRLAQMTTAKPVAKPAPKPAAKPVVAKTVTATIPVVKPQPKPVPAPTPVVVKPAPVVEEKEEAEEDAMANVKIFKKKIKARATFYESLTEEQKTEFRSYFVEGGTSKLVPELTYALKGNNDAFFEKVFNFIFKFRKLISLGLLVRLTEELLTLSEGDPEVQTILYEAATRVAYARRKDARFLAKAEEWARSDVKLHQTTLNSKGLNVYSFTRLAIILEKKGAIKEALALVEDSIKRGLKEKTKTGLEGRKARLLKKANKN